MIGGSLPPVISPWTRRIAAGPSRLDVDGGVGHRAASSGTDVADGGSAIVR